MHGATSRALCLHRVLRQHVHLALVPGAGPPSSFQFLGAGVQRATIACSNVLLAKQLDGATVERPQELQCRDKHARCSLAACALNGHVAAGSVDGSITVWDTESGLATQYLADEV
jgi:hypothetical protein